MLVTMGGTFRRGMNVFLSLSPSVLVSAHRALLLGLGCNQQSSCSPLNTHHSNPQGRTDWPRDALVCCSFVPSSTDKQSPSDLLETPHLLVTSNPQSQLQTFDPNKTSHATLPCDRISIFDSGGWPNPSRQSFEVKQQVSSTSVFLDTYSTEAEFHSSS